jgi:hypothetical protein
LLQKSASSFFVRLHYFVLLLQLQIKCVSLSFCLHIVSFLTCLHVPHLLHSACLYGHCYTSCLPDTGDDCISIFLHV